MSQPAMTTTTNEAKNGIAIETYRIAAEPFYLPFGEEISLFETAFRLKLPVMLKGPTGCGKTRFLQNSSHGSAAPFIAFSVSGLTTCLVPLLRCQREFNRCT